MLQLNQTSTGGPHLFNCGMAFHYSESLAKKKLIIMLPQMPLAKFAVGAFVIIDDFKSGCITKNLPFQDSIMLC